MKRHLSTFETILTQPSREFIYIFVFYHVITSRYSMSVSEGATCQNALLNNDEIQNQGLSCFYYLNAIRLPKYQLSVTGICTNLALKDSLDQHNIIYSSKDFRIEIFLFLTRFFFQNRAHSCKPTQLCHHNTDLTENIFC